MPEFWNTRKGKLPNNLYIAGEALEASEFVEVRGGLTTIVKLAAEDRRGKVRDKGAGGGLEPPPARTTRLLLEAPGCLRDGDGRAGAARRVGVAGPGRRATWRYGGHVGHERTRALAETVDRRAGQIGEGTRQRA